MDFFFQPANITSQILNFGLPAPIDLQVVGRNAERQLRDRPKSWPQRIARIPGAADVHVHQVADQPVIRLDVDRAKASQMGLTQRDVTSSMLISLSGSGTVAPEFLDELDQRHQLQHRRADTSIPNRFAGCSAAHSDLRIEYAGKQHDGRFAGRRCGGGYRFYRRFAERCVAGIRKSRSRMPNSTQLLSNLVSVQRSYMPVIVNHYNVWPVFDVYANVDRRDLGGVGADVRKIMREEEAHLPRGTSFELRGQIETMQSSFFRLGLGMIFAVVLVYLLMTVNFPILGGPFHHSDGTARRNCRDSVDAVHHRHDAQRSLVDGRHHVRRCGDREQHSDRHVRQRRARNADLRARGYALCRPCAGPPGADDGHGDDSWNGADGTGFGRGRRTECATGTRGDRRPAVRDGHDAVRGPDYLYVPPHAAPGRSQSRLDRWNRSGQTR